MNATQAFKKIYAEHTLGSMPVDLRIVAVFQTVTGDFMVVVFLCGRFTLFFLDRDWITYESIQFPWHSDESSVLAQAKEIARMIGAKEVSNERLA